MKVKYHGEFIEIDDKMEKGKKEQDIIGDENFNIEKTQEYDFNYILENNNKEDKNE